MERVLEKIVARATEEVFGRPLITNVWRSVVVEAIVAEALCSNGWSWVSRDYASCDFRNEKGVRLEVKQAAARQTWLPPSSQKSSRFDIAPRFGEWNGSSWGPHQAPMRNAEIFLFCYHPIINDGADHRDPQQWEFYLVRECSLPKAKSISLTRIKGLTTPVSFTSLPRAVSAIERSFENG